jgi:hypothetical protein
MAQQGTPPAGFSLCRVRKKNCYLFRTQIGFGGGEATEKLHFSI